MLIIWIVTLTFLALYGYKIIQLYAGWKRLDEFKNFNSREEITVSIIVPLRNEEDNITKLLTDLTEQDYPQTLFEVILVNDHSTDLTSRKIQPFCDKYSNIRLLELQKHHKGKKAALDAGVKNSTGEIVVTTDADCRVGKKWVSAIISYYTWCNKPEMIIGLVDMKSDNSVFSKFQQFEFTTLIAAGAGAAGISHPLFCNGANLIYKKSVYLKYADPLNTKSASGDDTLFMLKVKKDFKQGIKVLKSKTGVVYIKPQKNLHSFIRQRIRWTSKSKYYRDFDIISSAIIVLMTNVSLVISIILLLTLKNYLLFPVLFAVKNIADFVFVRETFRFFNKKNLVKYLVMFQFIYPFYITVIGILGNFATYSWKERKLR